MHSRTIQVFVMQLVQPLGVADHRYMLLGQITPKNCKKKKKKKKTKIGLANQRVSESLLFSALVSEPL